MEIFKWKLIHYYKMLLITFLVNLLNVPSFIKKFLWEKKLCC